MKCGNSPYHIARLLRCQTVDGSDKRRHSKDVKWQSEHVAVVGGKHTDEGGCDGDEKRRRGKKIQLNLKTQALMLILHFARFNQITWRLSRASSEVVVTKRRNES